MKPGTTVPAGAAPWAQTASGKALALGRVVPHGAIDIRRDIAVPLGNTGRFANQMPTGVIYPVAQHCNIGADWILAHYHDHRLALGFLLHEGHEAILGDWTEPVLSAMQAQLDEMRQEAGADIVPRLSVKKMKRRLADPIDRYLHEEAGLLWPMPPHMRDLIHIVDRRMLMTERQHLLAQPPRRWDDALERLQPLDLKHRIKPMPPAKAAENWILRFEQWSARVRGDGSRPELTRGAA
ncbi:hypothetical protein FG93_01968 [Bosea sp. LC85]|uniref:hypothetical protein n=1 Tax=Bosea sp. LC85 TaxID=1502851 RepID=UPI0004E467A9|nr:hypothetical protein [Bosea sp. LC85]KFC73224.1 hypothetical protein FG93_01968 [Bosea sp. LC85]